MKISKNQSPHAVFDMLLSTLDAIKAGDKVERQDWHKYVALLPDEALSEAHQAKIDTIFKTKQNGYKEAGLHLATRIFQAASDKQRARAALSMAADAEEEYKLKQAACQELTVLLIECLGKDLGRAINLLNVTGSSFNLQRELKEARKQANAQKKAATAAKRSV